ncbi:MAG: PGF-pre-PGF domain-containing protein [Candidatus ainarchaeum sp.]|nr:PGF-pre-PGF domain-containing protein [Candidatus ainarchaeum sp.]
MKYNNGLGNVPSGYLENIKSIITKYSSVSFNLEGLFSEYALPNVPFNEELITLLDSTNLNSQCEIYVDPEDIPLADGEYKIPIKVNCGEQSITKIIHLTLAGINQAYTIPETEVEVKEWVSKIENLPLGVVITTAVLDTATTIESTNTNQIKNIFKVIEITLDTTDTTSGTIYFSVDKTLVSNPNRVRLYVQEGTTWTELSTTYLKDNGVEYEYSAVTPHFSIFLIGEQKVVSGGGSYTSDDDEDYSYGGGISQEEEEEITPIINAENPTSEKNFFQRLADFFRLTGGAITGGAEGNLGAGIAVFFVVMIAIVGTIILLIIKKRS